MDQSFQTITVRNKQGARMVQAAVAASRLVLGEPSSGTGSHEKLASATVGSDAIVNKMLGKPIPDTGMPGWLGEIMAFSMRNLGPKGINFARYSIDYHILRNYLHVLDVWGQDRVTTSLPQYALDIVNYYISNDPVVADLVDKIGSKKMTNTST